MPKWYLIRTKQYKEAFVRRMLSERVSNLFLPLLRTDQTQRGRRIQAVVPLFPCYIFALFNRETDIHFVQRTPGVVGVLGAGDEPSEVDESVIEEIRSRATNGIVELPQRTFSPGEAVSIVGGPLRGINAIFDRYMSGSQRVALLVDLIAGASVRTIMPAALIAPTDTSSWATAALRRANGWK